MAYLQLFCIWIFMVGAVCIYDWIYLGIKNAIFPPITCSHAYDGGEFI
jgi:hypothetical protein